MNICKSKTAELLFIIAAIGAVSPVLAQTASGDTEQVLITGSRGLFGARTDLLGASFNTIEPLDLQLRQVEIVSDVLRDVPGIAVSRNGTVGNLTQVRIRGAEANHTLVMLDGIEANDPFAGEFDFASLLADEGARIEVLRGQQSALYGSNAIGGIIHYITLSGAEAPGFRARVEGGSFDTFSGSARIGGVTGPIDYAFSASLSRTGGAIGARNGIRHDSAENQAFSGKLIYTIADNAHITAVGRYTDLDAETTPQDFSFPPGPNFGLTYDVLRNNPAVQVASATQPRILYGSLRGDLELMDGRWTHVLTIQGVEADRKNYSDTHGLSSENYGTREKASYVTTFNFIAGMLSNALTFAADFKSETYQNKAVGAAPTPVNAQRKIDNQGYVGQYDLAVGDNIGFGVALRQDVNTHFKDASTYRVQGSYRIFDALRLRAAAGSGIRNPTNFELFGFNPATFVGNPDLKPERSEGWEAGFDFGFLANRVTLSASYFNNRLNDEIFTTFTPSFLASPANRPTDSTEEGVEVWVSARINEQWRVDASWTNLHALESSPPVQEVRRPPNVASLNVSWRAPGDRFGLNLTVRYNGEQRDFQFTPAASLRVPMPDYTLINLGADYRISDNWQIYARVENLLDKKYEEVFAYPAVGRAVYGGIRYSVR